MFVLVDPLKKLRKLLKANDLAAAIITHDDDYSNSFLHSKNEVLQQLSGFSGSAGIAIVTEHKAALFTDGRYSIQAKQELKKGWTSLPFGGTYFADFLKHLSKGSKVGFDGFCLSALQVAYFKKTLKHLILEPFAAPVFKYHHKNDVFLHDLFSGDKSEKITTVTKLLHKTKAHQLLVYDPASVAWLLNIRANGTPYSPIPAMRCLVDKKGKVQVFAPSTKGFDSNQNQTIKSESDILPFLKKRITLVDKAAPYNLWCAVQVKKNVSPPIKMMKAIKTDQEIAHITTAHIREGAWITLFLYQLEKGKFKSELGAIKGLAKIRRNDPLFWGESFPTISAFGASSALPHYIPKPKTNSSFRNGGAYMLDCGAHYLDGTTDLTRTLWLNKATKKPPLEFKRHYTLVLKAHINLAQGRFHKNPKASQLDNKARKVLLKHKLTYSHSTGHGVGNFLAVHESPPNIAKNQTQAIKPGMIFSNEPAVYFNNKYGIRLENLVTLTKNRTIKTLSLVPFETSLIIKKLLTKAELKWLNEYHQRVCQQLYALLPLETAKWLEVKTAPF